MACPLLFRASVHGAMWANFQPLAHVREVVSARLPNTYKSLLIHRLHCDREGEYKAKQFVS